MNSRVPWSVEGIEPAVRERAEAAARRAGMSLGEWISAQVGEMPPQFAPAAMPSRPPLPEKDAREVAEIHQRLDSIARQIEQMSRPGAARRTRRGAAVERRDLAARRPAGADQRTRPRGRSRAAQPRARPSGSNAPRAGLRRLAAAQPRLARFRDRRDRRAPERTRRRLQPPGAAACGRADRAADRAGDAGAPPPSADFSGLERQLRKITEQIDALQRPDGIEQSIAAFRTELAEIRQTITEAMPRRAIESIESQILSLAQRIDDSRQCGIDGQALAGVERALTEIRDVLRTLTPAEQLAGFDEAIRNLGGKIDMIVRTSDDPGTLQQLEGAIAALRAIVSNVASNEALAPAQRRRPGAVVEGRSARARRQQRFLRRAGTAHGRADCSRWRTASGRRRRTLGAARRRAAGAVGPARSSAGRQ